MKKSEKKALSMHPSQQIKFIEDYVRTELSGEASGHDWWHSHRVRNLALTIARAEGAELYLVEITALMHDIGDPKFYEGDETVAPRLVGLKLAEAGLAAKDKDKIMYIIAQMSYSQSLAGETDIEKSKEFMAVQDADRLDGIGAIGLARVFAYGGSKGRLIHDPNIKPKQNITKEEYRVSKGTSINHLYEKMLRLKDLMNTETGRRIAEERHLFIGQFLDRFYKEWDGQA